MVKILAFGNSFSVDGMEYLYPIARDLGIEIKFGNMAIGGCPLSRHLENAKEDLPTYEYLSNDNGKVEYTTQRKISEVVPTDEWDIITFQQFSGESGMKGTFAPLDELLPIIKSYLKKEPTLAWHSTWAYPKNSTHVWFEKYGKDQDRMYEGIIDGAKSVLARGDFTMLVPSGTAIQNARSSYLGDTLNRDDCHLSFGLGRYIAGLVWAKSLLHVDISKVQYAPEGVSEREKKLAIAAAEAAVNKPYELTELKEY